MLSLVRVMQKCQLFKQNKQKAPSLSFSCAGACVIVPWTPSTERVLQAQPLHRTSMRRPCLLLRDPGSAPLLHIRSSALLMYFFSWAFSSFSDWWCMYHLSHSVNSFLEQYCKSHSFNLAFCTCARSCLRGPSLHEIMGWVPDPLV